VVAAVEVEPLAKAGTGLASAYSYALGSGQVVFSLQRPRTGAIAAAGAVLGY